MVMFSGSNSLQGNPYSYYVTRRTPFASLHNYELASYNREVVPVYSDHDARIRGVPAEDEVTSDQYMKGFARDRGLTERSSSCNRATHTSTDRGSSARSSSCSRAVQVSSHQREGVREYIQQGGQGREYVVEEQILPQLTYHLPSQQTHLKLRALDDNTGRAQSVTPKPEGRSQWIKIPDEPGLFYYAPRNSDELKHRSYLDNRRHVFAEPQGMELKPWSEPKTQTYFDNRRAVFTEPQGSELRHYTTSIIPSTSYDTKQLRASLVPFDRSQSVPPSRSRDKSVPEYVTYEQFPKQDMSLAKKEIEIDQRFDRGHKDNHGSEYRSKWVRFPRGPSAFVYSSIHSRDKEACDDPAITGYVGSGNFNEPKERYQKKMENEYKQSSASHVNNSSSKVNKILNTKEDFEKKHFVDMLFNIQHILKEREALGAYEIPPKLKNKISILTRAIQNMSMQNRNRTYIGSHPTESVNNILSFSSMLAPIRPDRGRTNATTRFTYMLHGPRVL
ncbi:unnamed protein product [Meganyctiphanes norvegica]|uniref:Uncharacterized protein n=1 Tax=Meganyctiphanes norvegica TaxID=48144 RepID=A0AAV2RQC6_MEGNR